MRRLPFSLFLAQQLAVGMTSVVAGKVLNLERMSSQSDHADEDRRSATFLCLNQKLLIKEVKSILLPPLKSSS